MAAEGKGEAVREWSVAITTLVDGAAGDVDDGVVRILEALSDLGPAVSIGSEEATFQVAVRGDDVLDAAASGLDRVQRAVEAAGWPVDVRDVRVTEWSLFETRLEEPTYPELVGITEIAGLLGTSRQRASELARSRRFPAPVAELAAGPVWPKGTVARFVEEWDRRPGRPRSTV